MNDGLIRVTGGAGYIGSVLVPRLVGLRHRVRLLDRFFWGPGALADLPGVELVSRCEVHRYLKSFTEYFEDLLR